MGLNKAMLMGRVTSSPKLGRTSRGIVKCEFVVTTVEVIHGVRGGALRMELHHDVVAFGALASHCKEHLRRGSRVYVEGRNHPNRVTDSSGRGVVLHSVVAQAIESIGSAREMGAASYRPGASGFSSSDEEQVPTENGEHAQ